MSSTTTTATKIEDTRTYAELRRTGLGEGPGGYGPRNPNVFGASIRADGLVQLDDGQVKCWGTDDEIADALSTLDGGAGWEEAWDALSDLDSDA